jgi:hypothetical protein
MADQIVVGIIIAIFMLMVTRRLTVIDRLLKDWDEETKESKRQREMYRAFTDSLRAELYMVRKLVPPKEETQTVLALLESIQKRHLDRLREEVFADGRQRRRTGEEPKTVMVETGGGKSIWR